MACKQFENQILDYLENQLATAERTKVAAHLAGCAECRAFAEQLERLDAQLTHAIKSPTLSSAFDAKLRQRLKNTVLPEAEIAERKRRLQTEYEAGLARLDPFAFLSRKLIESLSYTALLAIAGWLAWSFLPQLTAFLTTPEVRIANLSVPTSWIVSAVFVLIGLTASSSKQIRRLREIAFVR